MDGHYVAVIGPSEASADEMVQAEAVGRLLAESGAVVVCDDYNWPGERKAVDVFCARQGLKVATTSHGQAVLRR